MEPTYWPSKISADTALAHSVGAQWRTSSARRVSGSDAMLRRNAHPETSSPYVTYERSSGAPSRLEDAKCT
eukprot:scaffold202_cov58-Phaeocystis_antarctica.AAC.3